MKIVIKQLMSPKHRNNNLPVYVKMLVVESYFLAGEGLLGFILMNNIFSML